MIIEKLLDFLFNVFSTLTRPIEIPPLPDNVSQFFNEVEQYFNSGLSILAVFTPLDYLLVLVGIVLTVDASILVYHFVMWVLKKIPMASIS